MKNVTIRRLIRHAFRATKHWLNTPMRGLPQYETCRCKCGHTHQIPKHTKRAMTIDELCGKPPGTFMNFVEERQSEERFVPFSDRKA